MRRLVEAQKARLLVAVAILVYFGALAALGGHSRWGRLGVPPGAVKFQDMRNVTGALECARSGVAVLPVNPCDPAHRPADFPRIWLALSHLGLGPSDTTALGVGLAVVFFVAALLVLPGRASFTAALLYIAAICSPAVMLGVERGNPDLAVFPFVVAAMLVSDGSRLRLVSSAVLLLFASVLKFYPVFAAGAFLRRATRASLVAAGAVLGCFALYLAATYQYVHLILASIQTPSTLAYGVRRPAIWFSAVAERTLGGFAWFRPWEVLLLVVGIGFGWLLGRSVRGRLVSSRGSDRDLDLFWAGACIFIGSYAVFQSQDYRLVFLLLGVPQLALWVSERHAAAIVTVLALLATLWLDVWTQMPGVEHILNWWLRNTAVGSATLPIGVIAQFALFASLVGWLFATVPVQVTAPFRRSSIESRADGGLHGIG